MTIFSAPVAAGGRRTRRMTIRRLHGAATLFLCLLGTGVADAAAQEVVPVEIGGEVAFPVAATAGESAPVRARRIEERLDRRLVSGLPLAPVRVDTEGDTAFVLVAQDTVASVSPADAEIAFGRSLAEGEATQAVRRLAEEWAGALGEAFERLALDERARVVVQGNPLFEVSGTPDLRAPRRAAAIAVRISNLAAAEAEPPPIRAVQTEDGAAVVAGDLVIAEISAAEATARDDEPLALAESWAEDVQAGVVILRRQRTGWRYALRLLLIAAGVGGVVYGLHLLLRRGRRALSRRQRRVATEGGVVRLMVAQWAVTVVSFLLWVAFVVFVLWLVPRTRPLTYTLAERALANLARAASWVSGDGVIVALIVVATALIARFVGVVVRQSILTFGARRGGRAALRVGTLTGIVAAGAQLVVIFIGALALLSQLEIDLLPLLASAGVAGIALGFGVQTLIRDFFTGFFILIEDQYGVGDVIRIGEVAGKVERFTLRITQIRSMDGSLTSVPNGEIKSVTNLSKEWAQVVLDVNIALGEDVDRATTVIAATAKQLADDWKDRVRGDPEVLGVETVDPAARAVAIRVILKTAPLEQFAISRELRRRILDAFAEAKIEVPPRAVVTLADVTGAR